MAGAASDGRVIIDTSLNNKGFIRGIHAMTGQTDGLRAAVKRLGFVIGTVFAVKTIIDFGRKAVEIGSDIAEVQNVVDVAFGDLAYKAEEFASTSITQFGMSTLAAKKTASTYMAMAKGMGVAKDEAAGMAITLAGLSGDVASFFNISQELADVKLKSVFTGETETLKDLGVVMTQDNLKAYALSRGFRKSYESMTQAEKVALRYQFVLDSLALANGDFARTQDSWANQTRILSMQWQEFMGILGQSIIAVLKPVVKWLNAVVSRLIVLANMLNSVVTRAFGGEKKQTAQAEATSSAIASSVENQDALTDAVEGTNKAQQKSLAGFDEINKLSGEAAGGAGGGGGGSSDMGLLELPEVLETPELEEPVFDSWGEAFSAFLDVLLAGVPKMEIAFEAFASGLSGVSQKLYDMLTFPGVLEKVRQLGHDLADAFNNLITAVDWELLGRTLGSGYNLALNGLTSFLYEFDWINLGDKLAGYINGLVYEIDWHEFGRLLWAKFKTALETFSGFILGLDMPALAEAAGSIIVGFFREMKNTLDTIEWYEIGAQIAEFLNNLDWGGMIDAIAGAVESFAGSILALIAGFIETADPQILIAAFGILAGRLALKAAFAFAKPIAKEVASQVSSQIAAALSSGVSLGSLGIAGLGAIAVAATVVAAVEIVVNWDQIKSMWGNILDGIKAIFSGDWGKADVDFTQAMLDWMNMDSFGVKFTKFLVDAVGGNGTWDSAKQAMESGLVTLGNTFDQFFGRIADGFSDAFNHSAQVWNGAGQWFDVHVIQPVGGFFSGLGTNISTCFSNSVSNAQAVWSRVSGWFRETVIEPVTGFFSGLCECISQFLSSAWISVQETWNCAGTWFSETVIEPVRQFFTGLWESVNQLSAGAWTAVQNTWNVVSEWFNTAVIQPVTGFFTQMWQNLQKLAAGTWTAIQDVWNIVSRWFNSTVIQPVAGFFSGMWQGIQQAASNVWSTVKGVWSAAASWFTQHVTQPLKSAFDAAGGAIKGTLNSLVGNVEGMINAIIKGVNWLISQLNKLSIEIPDNPITGAVSIGFDIPKFSQVTLPRLARGAVIPPNREFMAVLGDQSHGNNLEAPEELIRKIVREESGGNDYTALLQAILDAIKAGHIIMVDRTKLGQTVRNELNRQTRQSGRSVVLT